MPHLLTRVFWSHEYMILMSYFNYKDMYRFTTCWNVLKKSLFPLHNPCQCYSFILHYIKGVTSWLWVGIKIWWTRVEVWLKNTRVSVANEFVFCQNLNESPLNLNLHELPWSNTFLPREIQYFPNHSTTHRLLLCMRARIDRVSITCVTYMVHASRHVRVIHAQ